MNLRNPNIFLVNQKLLENSKQILGIFFKFPEFLKISDIGGVKDTLSLKKYVHEAALLKNTFLNFLPQKYVFIIAPSKKNCFQNYSFKNYIFKFTFSELLFQKNMDLIAIHQTDRKNKNNLNCHKYV